MGSLRSTHATGATARGARWQIRHIYLVLADNLDRVGGYSGSVLLILLRALSMVVSLEVV